MTAELNATSYPACSSMPLRSWGLCNVLHSRVRRPCGEIWSHRKADAMDGTIVCEHALPVMRQGPHHMSLTQKHGQIIRHPTVLLVRIRATYAACSCYRRETPLRYLHWHSMLTIDPRLSIVSIPSMSSLVMNSISSTRLMPFAQNASAALSAASS